MIITPKEAYLILVCMKKIEGSIRPGQLTGLQELDITTRLRECADKDGEE